MKRKQDSSQYNIGKNIHRFRLQNNLTQEEIAAKLQIRGITMSHRSYSHIECGSENIRVEEFQTLAEIFHVEAEGFFEGI